MVSIPFEGVTDDEILLAHPPHHLDEVKKAGIDCKELENGKHPASPDCYENMYTVKCAYLAAGGTVAAVNHILQESGRKVDSSFAIVRPPGHHAHCEEIGGFCFLNNVAIATRVAQ